MSPLWWCVYYRILDNETWQVSFDWHCGVNLPTDKLHITGKNICTLRMTDIMYTDLRKKRKWTPATTTKMLDNADILIYITIVPEAVFVITQLPAAYSQTEKMKHRERLLYIFLWVTFQSNEINQVQLSQSQMFEATLKMCCQGLRRTMRHCIVLFSG